MKVLILAYDFPPFVSVGGLRPWAWLRYLPRYGVEPVVVTRQWANRFGDERDYVAPGTTTSVEVERHPGGAVIRTPYRPNLANRLFLGPNPHRYRWIRKLVTAWYEVGQYYARIGPKAEIYRAARRYLTEQGADAIVATGEPFILFQYAAHLSREFGIPWVADYRDPWSQDMLRARHWVVRRWLSARERRTVGTAALITTVGESMRRLLGQLHGIERIEVIPNGFDPDAMAAAEGIEQDRSRLTIAFSGSIYAYHPLESVLSVLEEAALSDQDTPLALHFIGVGGRQALEHLIRVRFPELERKTIFTPRLSNADMARELARANVLLMFNNYAFTGTKVYDYLAVARRILLCYTDDSEADSLRDRHFNLATPPGAEGRELERIVKATRSGVAVRDAGHLRRVLAELRDEFTREGRIACEPVDVGQYSRAAQTRLLADLLKRLAG